MSRYCFNCDRITVGEPLFCNHCGRSYSVKLCPRLHSNPRGAEACSQCGSRDLSTPQPRVPLWVPILEFLIRIAPGVVLTAFTIGVTALFIVELARRPQMLAAVVLLLISLGFLWWVWSQLPVWFRRAVHGLLIRRREGDTGKERH